MKTTKKTVLRHRRKHRIRAVISGTAQRPRLSVFRSLKKTTAQLINDEDGTTIVQVNSDAKNIDSSKKLGEELAKKAAEKKVSTCVFDRNGYDYHGRVKAIAEGAREGGLKF